jgi:hypothetical protein
LSITIHVVHRDDPGVIRRQEVPVKNFSGWLVASALFFAAAITGVISGHSSESLVGFGMGAFFGILGLSRMKGARSKTR